MDWTLAFKWPISWSWTKKKVNTGCLKTFDWQLYNFPHSFMYNSSRTQTMKVGKVTWASVSGVKQTADEQKVHILFSYRTSWNLYQHVNFDGIYTHRLGTPNSQLKPRWCFSSLAEPVPTVASDWCSCVFFFPALLCVNTTEEISNFWDTQISLSGTNHHATVSQVTNHIAAPFWWSLTEARPASVWFHALQCCHVIGWLDLK